ncbi:MAG: (deoxy)nucleoside triphosphate pyrophosphohydrolase [Deltaproteobacteria bacterium]|nr:(deoxy)nucleoside triphosphate pyrophosphohydrolase [Deltaproteobacteria bacterium]
MSAGSGIRDARPVAVALVEVGPPEDPRYVVTRRRPDAHLPGAWELPGGRIEPDETPDAAVRRELAEELGVTVAEATPLTWSWFTYPERAVLLLFFHVRLAPDSPAPAPLAATELALVTRASLREVPFPPANAPLLAALDRLSPPENRP